MKISFKWSGAIINGTIISQKPSVLMGKVTHIKDNKTSTEYFLHGKCEVGFCGPFTVISIK